MTDPKQFTENLDDMPLADAIRTVMQRAVDSGIPLQEVIDDAFGAVVAKAHETDGPAVTAGRLLMVAKALTDMIPPTGQPTN
jgi:hypothetical protein